MVANIYFGSSEQSKESLGKRINPYNAEVASEFVKCDADDAKKP